jgi:hypothetical protein
VRLVEHWASNRGAQQTAADDQSAHQTSVILWKEREREHNTKTKYQKSSETNNADSDIKK